MRGQSLLEIIVATAVAAAFFAGALFVLRFALVRNGNASTREEVKADLNDLVLAINRIGRTASLCNKISTPIPTCPGTVIAGILSGLECSVDFSSPPLGNPVNVRFLWDSCANKIYFEKMISGLWNRESTYNGVQAFDVCADTDPSLSCPLLPAKISAEALAHASGRFFRYQIVGVPFNVGKESYNTQSAFFIRNPGPGGIKYGWGDVE